MLAFTKAAVHIYVYLCLFFTLIVELSDSDHIYCMCVHVLSRAVCLSFILTVPFFLPLLVAPLFSLPHRVLPLFHPSPLTFDSLDSLVPPPVPAMADSSFVTLGTARSLLVDSSVCDSRIAETTKDHVFLGMACEDGQSAGSQLPFYFH